ncbi:hypothetical protein ACLBV0_04420 [Pseudomonas aeruginosa]|uniref:hypothetical protein n=1 Tax=Pseudomonas aeruginosa TaxID=287 RepID=UPI00396A7AC0
MNKANECTCPSGDGSLVHPCPAHPAVEQVGVDERATFELFVRKHCGMPAHIAVNWDAKFTNDAWAGWQARAALAQPSPAHPAPVEQVGTNVGHGHVFPRADGVKMRCGGPGLCSECAADASRARAALAQPSPTTDSRPAEWSSYDPTWVVDFIRDNSIFNADLIERMLEYATRPAGDVPQAEQAEAERPEGPTEDELEAAGLGYPLHKEEAVKLWYSGFRSEVITVLEAWEAIGHDIGMNPDKGELLDSLRYMLEKCEAHDAALARVAELERQEPVATVAKVPGEDWNSLDFHRDLQDMQPGTKFYAAPVAQAQQLHDLDKQCRDDVARALGLRPNQERGFAWSYLLASIKSCVKASEDSAQAQHCVPELLVRAEDFVSGKEVPQAWLDVQAERRRQITAEGWTPEHDDLYCAAELPRAAAAYILSGANDEAPAIWPFSAKWWKPRDARANYMRAGALILAEIERLDRAAAAGKEVGHE